MKERLLSIIVPVYNVLPYLEKCIESVINQTYKNIEVILVDDGSTDGSGDICDRYAKNDYRIKTYHIENGGSVKARKIGLERANGSYIGFVDSDDYITLDMYERLVQILEKYEADFVASNYYEVRDDFISKVESLEDEFVVINNQAKRKECFSNYYFFGPHMIPYGLVLKIYKKEFIVDCFSYIPEEQQFGEDSLVLMWMLIKAKKFATTRDAFYYYRILNSSLSHFDSKEMVKKEYILSRCRQDIVDQHKDIIDEKAFWNFIGKKMQIAYECRARVDRVPAKYRYYFDDINSLFEKKILIYGAGRVGTDYYYQLNESGVDVVAVADIKAELLYFPYSCPVIKPDDIINTQYDIILIAIFDSSSVTNVKNQLRLMGIPDRKIIWSEPKVM